MELGSEEETETGLSDFEEDEEEETKPRLGRPKETHMWNMRRTSNLQLLVAACGTPLAWTKFSDGETAAEVVSFLATAHAASVSHESPTPAFPSYIAYDRACHVLRHVLSSLRPSSPTSSPVKPLSLPSFLQSTRLIVTAFHKRSHTRDDPFCDEFCNPTPLDGEAPDLVVPFRPAGKRRSKKRGQDDELRTFERAFNTSVRVFPDPRHAVREG
ncbi:hypothetical protein Rhopal_004013-T1 [Rhodotorula paludigena]|uniref:Uncharacterized protein n=1 Tax=Rhodotorula paludigena TaxID=86838 RepID=A0AAV5GKJ3_9BASI|nr:hypothetical protein Rhopal_004013-T1 [Rhodotorula paludigena]